MRHILEIGFTDLRRFFRKKGSAVTLFMIPLPFIYFIGLSSLKFSNTHNRTSPVCIQNMDHGFLGKLFVEELKTQNIQIVSHALGNAAVSDIRIPDDFTAKIMEGKRTGVRLLKHDGVNDADAMLIEARLVRALILINGYRLEADTTLGSSGTLTEESFHSIMTRSRLVSIESNYAGQKPIPSGFNFSLPGILIMFLTLNSLSSGGSALAEGRRSGNIKRLIAHSVTNFEIVMGKIYGLVLIGSLQIVFFVVVGKFLFHVNFGANVPAVTLTLVILAWVCASLGVFVGSVISHDDRIPGICALASTLMAGLGGCWWPLEICPDILKNIALCLPTGWAVDALHQLISFGNTTHDIMLPIAVLLCFGSVFNFCAVRYFRV